MHVNEALLKKLTDINGLPSWEEDVREAIKGEIKDHVDSLYTDRLGNLIAVKNEKADGAHIGLSAHMDEVGLVVKEIDKSGLIKFSSWGVLSKIMPSKVVKIGKDQVYGVIGGKPIHLQKLEERESIIETDKLYIDIGATSKEDAEKHVELGDYIVFDSSYRQLGNNKIKAKALDDRLGCAAIIEILQSDTKRKLTAVFCTQEEIGFRGSAVAANQVFADLIINLEGTVSADSEDTDEHKRVTILGDGPAVSIIDRTSIFLKKYYERLFDVAKDNDIPLQYRQTGMGGTDAGRYHTAHSGTPVIGVAVPCRYIHTPVSVFDTQDYCNMVKLVKIFIDNYVEE